MIRSNKRAVRNEIFRTAFLRLCVRRGSAWASAFGRSISVKITFDQSAKYLYRSSGFDPTRAISYSTNRSILRIFRRKHACFAKVWHVPHLNCRVPVLHEKLTPRNVVSRTSLGNGWAVRRRFDRKADRNIVSLLLTLKKSFVLQGSYAGKK